MIQQQQTMILSPYMEIYDLVVPNDNLLRQINELIDFSFDSTHTKARYNQKSTREILQDRSKKIK